MIPPETPPDPSRQAFSYPSYRFFWVTSIAASFAGQIVSVAVGWQIYDITHQAIYLGFVGLAQFLPALLLVLVTGLVADRFPRRRILQICSGIEIVCGITLVTLVAVRTTEVWPIFAVLVVMGASRAFVGPAASSLAPNLVPPEALSNAITMNTTAWQLAGIVGPMVGGLLYGLGGWVPYATAAALALCAMVSISLVTPPAQRISNQKATLETLLAGVRYIFSQKVVLGAISLDLFAVLMGGAVALMPIFARDILVVGPLGLGLLRAAPGAGAIVTALILTRYPIRDHAGAILFIFVAGFGIFTTAFGLSTSVWLSIPLLAAIGACDMVSVSIRETIMQLWTPDDVRGRVNAVNSVFIGASNELGEFRAGLMAAWIGAQAAVALGGIATTGVALIWSQAFPGLRTQRSLDRALVEG